MRQLNLDQLVTLKTISETGGFTAAARQLNLTQSAVSVQIRELEERFGVRLLDRLGKTAHLTPAGRDLLPFIERLLTIAADAQRALKRYQDGWLGEVRIGASNTAMIYHLPAVLAPLRRAHPSLEVHLTTGTTTTITDRLVRNEIDLGIVSLPLNERGLLVTRLLTETLVAIFPAGTTALPATITAAHFQSVPLLLETGRAQIKRNILDWLAAHGDAPKPAMELDNLEVVARMVSAGLGASIVPQSVVGEREASGQLAVRPLRPSLKRELVLIQRADKPMTDAIKHTREALQRMS